MPRVQMNASQRSDPESPVKIIVRFDLSPKNRSGLRHPGAVMSGMLGCQVDVVVSVKETQCLAMGLHDRTWPARTIAKGYITSESEKNR